MPSLQTASGIRSLEKTKFSEHLEGQSNPLSDLSMGADALTGPKSDSSALEVFLRTGDAEDFKKFCDAVWPSYYRIAVRIVSDHQLAEDVVQTTLFQIFKSIHASQPEKPDAWGRKAVVNTAYNALRDRRKIRDHVPVNLSQMAGCEPEAKYQAPDEQLAIAEIVQNVRSAIAELPETCSSLLKQSMYDGVKYKTLAEQHNLPLGTVKRRLFRARELLARRLEPPHDTDL